MGRSNPITLKLLNNNHVRMESGADAPLFLSERLSAFLGFRRIAQTAGYPKAGPYLVPIAGWMLGGVFLSGLSYFLTDRSQFQTPFTLIIPMGLVVGLMLAKWVRNHYVTAVKSLPGDELNEENLLSIPARWIPLGLFAVFYIGYLVTLSLSPGEVSAFITAHGEYIAYIKYIFITPFYLIVIADVAALLIASMLLLPWKIHQYNVRLDFSDITGFAGLYEVSRLLRVGTLTYFVGLIIWTAVLVTPSIVGGVTAVSTTDEVIFIVFWILGLVMYLCPFFLLHRHMSHEKERYISQLDANIRSFDLGVNNWRILYTNPDTRDILQLQTRFIELQTKFIELQQVRESREYPVNSTILEDLAIGALSPIAFEWILSLLLA